MHQYKPESSRLDWRNDASLYSAYMDCDLPLEREESIFTPEDVIYLKAMGITV